MPEKVATACSKLNDLVGAEYTPIAYLGSQLVNGVNHAVLAEQLLITGKDVKNVVLVIFNEKESDCTLVSIERVIDGSNAMGGNVVDVKTDIPVDALVIFERSFAGFVGSTVKPFALLATQVVSGIDYKFAAEVIPVVPDAETKVAVVTVNSLSGAISFADVLK
jgi:hypothetical protein